MSDPNTKTKYELLECGIALYEFDDLQDAVDGLAELNKRFGCTWDSDSSKLKPLKTNPNHERPKRPSNRTKRRRHRRRILGDDDEPTDDLDDFEIPEDLETHQL